MKHILKTTLIFIILSCFAETRAETWDEPWQKEIIQKSEVFIFGKVIETDGKTAKVEILKNLSSTELEDEITIEEFFLLALTSSSGRGVHLSLETGSSYYFFLKKNDNGNYSLPTPTSGYAYLHEEKNIVATYRHSYHQALVSQEIYELTYINIWNYYKTGKFHDEKINEYISSQLAIKPASFENQDEINIFFSQHVALETAYLLDLSPDFEKVTSFISCDNFHLRVSALQLLGNYKTDKSKDILLKSITNEDHSDFEKVIAIWSLKKIADPNYISKLKQIQDNLSDEETGFGGNIMDPRIGTYFPSPRSAIEDI